MKAGVLEVARAAQVSTATVSRVFAGLGSVNAVMRARVEQAAARLGYVPDSAAKALRSGRTRLVGVALPTLDHAFFARMTDGFQDVMSAAGYAVLIATVGFDNSHLLTGVRELISRGAEALMTVGRIDDPSLQAWLNEKRTPVVTTYTTNATPGVVAVGFDNYQAIKQVVEFLLMLGHRRVAMIAGPIHGNDRQQSRIQAFTDARRNHRVREAWPVIERPYEHALEEGAAAMRQIHLEHPEVTAVVCNSDTFAFAALEVCRKLKVAVPGHISIVGHDDQDFASVLDPPLTTVTVPAREMGIVAAEQLIRFLEKKVPLQSVELDAPLVTRGSCARPRR